MTENKPMPVWGRWVLVLCYIFTAVIVYQLGHDAGYKEAACDAVKMVRGQAVIQGNMAGYIATASQQDALCQD